MFVSWWGEVSTAKFSPWKLETIAYKGKKKKKNYGRKEGKRVEGRRKEGKADERKRKSKHRPCLQIFLLLSDLHPWLGLSSSLPGECLLGRPAALKGWVGKIPLCAGCKTSA